jgi:hypothetical protein
MRFPFVSRARYADRERDILELKEELAELKYAHARVVDEISFRSTGFHIDERFIGKESAAAPQPEVKQEEPNPVDTAPNMSARRRQLEIATSSNLEKAEAEARTARDRARQAEAAERMAEILEKTKAAAATA